MNQRPLFRRAAAAAALLLAAAGEGCDTASPAPALAPADVPARVEALAHGYEARWPNVPQVTAADLQAAPLDQKPILIDARSLAERRVSAIPGALSIDQLPDAPQRPVLVYCTIGHRSTQFAAQLRQRGIDARNLHGGVLAWAHAGGSFVTPQGDPTHAVHVYDRPWDLLPEPYESHY